MERCQLQIFAVRKHCGFISRRDQMSCLRTFPPNSMSAAIVALPGTPMFLDGGLSPRNAGSPESYRVASHHQCGQADISQVCGTLDPRICDSHCAASRKLHCTDKSHTAPAGWKEFARRSHRPRTEATFARLSTVRSQYGAVAYFRSHALLEVAVACDKEIVFSTKAFHLR